jgi:hypothetical protein
MVIIVLGAIDMHYINLIGDRTKRKSHLNRCCTFRLGKNYLLLLLENKLMRTMESTLRHWRLFSHAFSPLGAAAPSIRGSAACTTGIYEDPATPNLNFQQEYVYPYYM